MATEKDDGTYYLEKLSLIGDSDDDYQYEEVPVDDLSSLGTADVGEDWNKTINIIEQSRRDQKIETKAESPSLPSMIQRPEVADDFVRNFLRRNNLKRTLDCFQTEWYEKKQKGQLDNVESYNVPDAFHSLILLTEEVKKLQNENEKFKSAASIAKESYVKVMKERDFHRMHHLRIVQEKNRLITDIKRLRKHYKSYEPALKSLTTKYESALREKMLTKLERDRAVGKVTSLQASLRNVENGRDDTAPTSPTTGYRAERADHCEGPTQIKLKKNREAAEKTSTEEKDVKVGNKKDSVFPIDTRVNPQLAMIKGPPPNLSRSGGYRQNGIIRAHQMPVSSVALHPRKQIAVTTSDDHTWKMWSMPSGDVIMSGQGHNDWVSHAEYSPDGNLLATSSGDCCVKLWSFQKSSCIVTFSEHKQAVWGVDYHHTGHFVASCSMDQTVKIWDLNSERCVGTMRGHTDSINSIQFVPFGNTLLTGSADKTISMWDPRTKICAHTFFGHNYSINDAKFAVRGDAVVSCDSFGIVKMWDVRTITEMLSYDVGPHPCNSISIDPTSHSIAVGSNDSSIKMIDVVTGAVTALPGHDDACNSVLYDVTGTYIVSGGSDGNLRVWS